MVLAPAGSAVAPHATIAAPYTGSVVNSNSWSVSACAKAKITSPAAFSLTSGVGTFAGMTSAKTCKNSFGGNQYSSAGVFGGSTVAIKVTTATSGAKTVVANWTITATGAQNMTSTTCVMSKTATYSYCDQYAAVYVSAYAYLVDLKNGSYFYTTTYFFENTTSYVDAYCYQGTCYSYSSGSSPGSFSGAMNVLFSFSGTLNSKHTYALYTYFSASAGVTFGTANAHFSGGAHGTASIDMATGGNGAVLNSVTVT
jgi:hypothetical protein